MVLDDPNNKKVEETEVSGEGSTEKASEKLIQDTNSSDQRPAQAPQEQDTSGKALPKVDMYSFHQGDRPAAVPASDAKPSKERADAAAPQDVQIVDDKRAPAKAKPETADAQPADATRTDAKPADATQTDAKPANGAQPDAKPADGARTDAKPGQDAQAATDAKPADATRTDEAAPKDGMTEAEREHTRAFREKLEKQNFNLKPIEKGWGTYQALESMVKDGTIKMTPAEMKKEAIRIRDREFEKSGKKHFTVNDSPQMWSKEEIDNMVKKELGSFREAEQKRVAAEKTAAEERARAESEKQLRDQTSVALEKHVPAQDKLQSAAKENGLNVGDEQMKQFRDRLKEHTFKEIARGTMKPEDLERPMPRVGGVFVAMGAATEEQLGKALQKQEEARKAGQKPAQLGDLLKEELKGNKEALARLDIASKFYDKLYEEVTGKPRVAPQPAEQKDQPVKPAQKQPEDPKLKIRR